MKRALLFAVTAALLLALAGLAAVQYIKARDHAAKQTILASIPLLDSYHEQHSAFPPSFSSVATPPTSVWGVFPAPRVRYTADATHYALRYYQLPLGPFHCYDSASRAWFYDE